MENFKNRIRQARGKMSQAEFAERLKINVNTLRNYERGDSLPNLKIGSEMCIKLGISPHWLLFGEGPMAAGDTPVIPDAPTLSAQPTAAPQATQKPEGLTDQTSLGAQLVQLVREMREDSVRDANEIRELKVENKELMKENMALRVENTQLTMRAAALEERLREMEAIEEEEEESIKKNAVSTAA